MRGRRGLARRRALALNRQLVQTMPGEDVGVCFEARRIVGDPNASVANRDSFQMAPFERRAFVVTDKIHESADQTDAGCVDGVAECARQTGSTFLRRPWHGAVTETEPHALDRARQDNPPRASSSRCRARTDIGRAAAHEGRSISPYRMQWLCMAG